MATDLSAWQSMGATVADLVADLLETPPSATTEPAPVVPACPDCQGAGYYTEQVPYGHPHFGVLFPCGCKVTVLERRRQAELLRLSNLSAFEDMSFECFDVGVPGGREAYQAAFAYAQAPRGWLILLGSYGVGKTHLAAAIALTAIARHASVLFAVVPDLLDHLRATFGPNSEVAYDERFELVRTVPLLVLDDLGTENATPWAREKLFQIINYRYQERLPTVITSNHSLNELEPRLVSRLADRRYSQIIEIAARDYRRHGSEGIV